HPITGAGIAPAVASGERAGASVARALSGDAHALAAYEEEMREEFGPALERALAARRRMADVWNSPAAEDDTEHRRGWIAFPEYFS
ncbi:MAG TPA: hypothetical protein VEH51_14635, partial [Burkholderiales bacterium]|nr:hypothetical protein [Burkholderiales bacterium]